MVLDGALKMLQAQTSPAAKSMVEMSIIESRHRIEFLEGELKKLSMKRVSEVKTPAKSVTIKSPSTPVPTNTSDKSVLSAPTDTNFDLLRYENTITTEKVKFRFKEIALKLDIESRVKSGSENMMSAFVKGLDLDVKRQAELENQLAMSKAKESLLAKAKNRYSQLYIPEEEEFEDALIINGIDLLKQTLARK